MWLPQTNVHVSQHLNWGKRPQAQDLDKNMRTFLEDPDPKRKLMSLINMAGSLDHALKLLDGYENNHYINSVDASKIRTLSTKL